MNRAGCIIGIPLGLLALTALFFGVLWVWASTAAEAGAQAGNRLAVGMCLIALGLVLVGVAVFLIYRGYRATQEEKPTTIIQKIDLPGDLSLNQTEQLKCRECGGPLNKDNISVREGAVVVTCPYCGTSYEIEEKPKW